MIRPKLCLWPTPDWLWENDASVFQGPNPGPWKTLETRSWMEHLGYKWHAVMKDGEYVVK